MSIDDLVTHNADIAQFCGDVVSLWADESLLRVAWRALAGNAHRERKSSEDAANGLTILDPTCGSGAFLFAALNVLQPLYEACLDRMKEFVAEADAKSLPRKVPDFREVVSHVEDRARHPRRDYFVLKSIIVNNLFGVDLMEEATEICKLRLFLKLAASAEPDESRPNKGIEPLPDIDFNIRAGNALVGFATQADLDRAYTLGYSGVREQVLADAGDMDAAYQLFRGLQLEGGDDEMPRAKADLQARVDKMRAQLDKALAEDYQIGLTRDASKYLQWRASHEPFHWFIEFFGVLKHGGFDVIIGNPPYVEYSTIRRVADEKRNIAEERYNVKNFKTESCGNLHAFVTERALELLKPDGAISLIVPLSASSISSFKPVQELMFKTGTSWNSYFSGDRNPAELFTGVKIRATIWLRLSTPERRAYATKYLRWYTSCRDQVFPLLNYAEVTFANFPIPKMGADVERGILQKLNTDTKTLRAASGASDSQFFYHAAPIFWTKALLSLEPLRERSLNVSDAYKEIGTSSEWRDFAFCLANSDLLYWFWSLKSDCYNQTKIYLDQFPVKETKPSKKFAQLAVRLQESLMANCKIATYEYKGKGAVTFAQFYPKYSKSIIDEIDQVLAEHYGFTDEELDFILNYDIKYRMGRDAGDE